MSIHHQRAFRAESSCIGTKTPPPEIAENFDYHRKLNGFEVRIMDFAEATEWLYDNYGIEARNIFLNARHPAEAADLFAATSIAGAWRMVARC